MKTFVFFLEKFHIILQTLESKKVRILILQFHLRPQGVVYSGPKRKPTIAHMVK